MSLRDDLIKLADEKPHLVLDLMPLLEAATGASCCRKPQPVPDSVLRKKTIRLAHSEMGLRPHLLPLLK